VRLYGDFEFGLLFTSYIIINSEPSSLHDLDGPFDSILNYKETTGKFMNRDFNILETYEEIAKNIHNEPFRVLSENNQDQKKTIKSSRDAVDEWEERKEILKEILLSIKSLYIFARHLTADTSGYLIKVERKMEKYECAVNNFQVDSQGPSLNHFISLFYQLQRVVQSVDSHRELAPSTGKLFYLFKVYWHHLIKNQITDPLLFPKKMLALVSQFRNRSDRTMFTSLKLSINDILTKSIKHLQNGDIYNILCKKRENQLLEIYRLHGNLDDAICDLGKGLWDNFLLYGDNLTPYEQWTIKTYLSLQFEMAKMGIKLEENVCQKFLKSRHF
jgi:hypothetical protein